MRWRSIAARHRIPQGGSHDSSQRRDGPHRHPGPCGHAPARSRHRAAGGRRTRHSGQLPGRGHRHPAHRLRLRPLRCAERRGDGGLGRLAVPRGRHLHRRAEPDLRCAAEPHPGVGRAGLEGLAPDPDLPGSSGPVRRPPPGGALHEPATPPPRGRRMRSPRSPRPGRWACCPGSAIYGDMENYNATDTSCRDAVRRYVSSWTKELHRVGYLSGMYVNLGSGAQHLDDSYSSTAYARPDALWIARYDHVASLTGWTGIPDTRWSNHQRAKQYWAERTRDLRRGDDDRRQQPVGRPGRHRRVRLHGDQRTPLNARRGPGTSYPVASHLPDGHDPQDRLPDPGLDRRQHGGVGQADQRRVRHRPLPQHPVQHHLQPATAALQVPVPGDPVHAQRAARPVEQLRGEGDAAGGALAWVFCQTPARRSTPPRSWDRLDDGYYVTDYYLATPSKTTYSRPIPRC